jgi:hypothetical protein
MPAQIPLGKRRVVPRQRRQHLVRIMCSRLIRQTNGLCPFDNRRAGLAHPHQSDVLLRMRCHRVHPDAQPVL